MKDYYKILGLKREATKDEIKKSFRKHAQKYHPDKNPNSENHANKFKEINEAYQTLSDEKLKREYDFMLSGGGFGRSHHDFFGGFNDLFGDIFGKRRQERRQPEEPTVRISATVSELLSGKTKRSFKLIDEIQCKDCNGIGGESKEVCKNCRGTGHVVSVVRQGNIVFQSSGPCNTCHGSGSVILNVCRTCLGNGFIKKEKVFDVFVTCKRR